MPEGKVYRDDTCSQCGKSLRSCRNCLYYAPGQQYDCKEHISEQVTDKESANYCDSYSPNRSTEQGSGEKKKKDDARNAFDKLFG